MTKRKMVVDGWSYTVDDEMQCYLYRGLAGEYFSAGLDNFNREMLLGMANVLPFGTAREITKDIIRRNKKTPTSFLVGGHSLGAAEALRQANELDKAGVNVVCCLLLDYVPRGCRLWYKPEVKGNYPCLHVYTTDPRVKQVKGANNRKAPEGTNHIELDDDREVWEWIDEFMTKYARENSDD